MRGVGQVSQYINDGRFAMKEKKTGLRLPAMLGTVRWSENVSLRRGSLSSDLAVWKSTHTIHMHAPLKWPLSIPGRILPQTAECKGPVVEDRQTKDGSK